MTLRHAAALALVGWYLMVPPSARDLDGSCNGKNILWNVVESLSTEHHLASEAAGCNRENRQLAGDAPLSKWKRSGADDTLAQCQARYQERQKAVVNHRLTAKLELADEGNENPSDQELNTRADALTSFVKAQTAAEKCVSSDDPQLKAN